MGYDGGGYAEKP